MKPHQERVIVERDELATKLENLTVFLGGKTFQTLSVDEQGRLFQQRGLMTQYLAVLNARIAAFS